MNGKGGIGGRRARKLCPRVSASRSRGFAVGGKTAFAAGALMATAALVVSVAFLSSCSQKKEAATSADKKAASVPVRVLPLVPRDFVEYGEYYGEVTPVQEARLQSVTGGRVDAVLAKPGDAVHAGESLARIDADRAQSIYDTAVLNEQVARHNYAVKKKLNMNGNASDVAVDQAHLAWLQSRTSLIDSKKALEGALAVSPMDGIVIARYIEPYDELDAGQSTFAVADTAKMKVTVGVPEADIAGVDRLYSAEIRLSSLPDRIWHGTPVSIAKKRSVSSRAYEVQILIDNADGLILSGTTATVRIGLRKHAGQIIVPTSALRTEGELTYVMVANSPTARKKPVKTGPSSLTETVICSGLSAGEELIVEGINQVRDGDRVDVRK